MQTITYRQGDVALSQVSAIPADATPRPRDNGRIVLAYGEVTGHAHAITDPGVECLVAPDGRVYLRVPDSAATLVHEEHTAHRLLPGAYEVTIQQEWQDEESRNVSD